MGLCLGFKTFIVNCIFEYLSEKEKMEDLKLEQLASVIFH